ncbi:MAG: LytTR family DNA-binding domain-containing protein [Bacteroidota bacterium]
MQPYFFIKVNARFTKIHFQEIVLVEACKNYMKIVTDGEVHLVLLTMKRMEALLPSTSFRRIHKSFIVSLDKVSDFDAERVYIKDKTIPVGQLYRRVLESSFIIANDLVPERQRSNTFHTIPMLPPKQSRLMVFDA